MSIKSFGVSVTVGGTTIGGLTSVTPGGKDVNFIQTTTHEATGKAHTFIGGLIDNGSLDLEGNYDITDAGQLKLLDDAGDTAAVVVTMSDGSTHTFSAVIGAYNIGNPLDDTVTFTCSLKVTGPITSAAS